MMEHRTDVWRSMYVDHLRRWLTVYPPESLLVLPSEDLKAAPSFLQRPQQHLVINAVETPMRGPLGELGTLVASRGGHAACLDAKLCGAFKGGAAVLLELEPAGLGGGGEAAAEDGGSAAAFDCSASFSRCAPMVFCHARLAA